MPLLYIHTNLWLTPGSEAVPDIPEAEGISGIAEVTMVLTYL